MCVVLCTLYYIRMYVAGFFFYFLKGVVAAEKITSVIKRWNISKLFSLIRAVFVEREHKTTFEKFYLIVASLVHIIPTLMAKWFFYRLHFLCLRCVLITYIVYVVFWNDEKTENVGRWESAEWMTMNMVCCRNFGRWNWLEEWGIELNLFRMDWLSNSTANPVFCWSVLLSCKGPVFRSNYVKWPAFSKIFPKKLSFISIQVKK